MGKITDDRAVAVTTTPENEQHRTHFVGECANELRMTETQNGAQEQARQETEQQEAHSEPASDLNSQ